MPTLTYELIASSVLNNSGFSFTSIPQTYTDLRVVITGRAATNGWYGITYNNNGSNYNNQGWGAGAANSTRNSYLGYSYIVYTANSSTNAQYATSITLDIFDYTGNTPKSSYLVWSANRNTDGTNNASDTEYWFTTWLNTAAITSIQSQSATWVSGTQVELYGIKREV